MFLRSSQYQRQARFQTSGNCTVQKRLFGSQKTDFSKFMYNLKIATRWVCVQVVPSGRASIKSNQVKKKEKKEEDTKLNPCNQFFHEEKFSAEPGGPTIAISSISGFLACSSSSDLFF